LVGLVMGIIFRKSLDPSNFNGILTKSSFKKAGKTQTTLSGMFDPEQYKSFE